MYENPSSNLITNKNKNKNPHKISKLVFFSVIGCKLKQNHFKQKLQYKSISIHYNFKANEVTSSNSHIMYTQSEKERLQHTDGKNHKDGSTSRHTLFMD